MPVDQTADYDRALQMLKMEVSKDVELTEQEFMELVQDNWSWKRQFSLSNASLSATAMSYRKRR